MSFLFINANQSVGTINKNICRKDKMINTLNLHCYLTFIHI